MSFKFKIGDTAFFHQKTYRRYDIKLEPYQKMIIYNIGFDNAADMYYSVTNSIDNTKSWFHQDDLLTTIEMRKIKIKTLNNAN